MSLPAPLGPTQVVEDTFVVSPEHEAYGVDLRYTFAPSDCQAYIMLPVYQGANLVGRDVWQLGEVVLFSLSAHRDKFPISRLGRVIPIGFTAGRRTVAGTIGLTLWDRNTLRRVAEALYEKYRQYTDTVHTDEFPPLDIVLVFVNEIGAAVTVTLNGVTVLDEGFSLNADDSRSVLTLSYMAVDFSIRTDPLGPAQELPSVEPEEVRIQGPVQILRYRVVPDTNKQPIQEPVGVPQIQVPAQSFGTVEAPSLLPSIVDYPLQIPDHSFRSIFHYYLGVGR